MKILRLEKDGHTLSGVALAGDDQIWIHLNGRTFSVPTQAATSSRRNAHKSNVKSGNIAAPMPGKITKILVKKGDKVEENQNILVMEAMKMEYSLKSQIPGVVKDICFDVNSQVSLGTTLAIIEKAT